MTVTSHGHQSRLTTSLSITSRPIKEGLRLLGGEQGPQDQKPSSLGRDWSPVTGHRIILGRGEKAVRGERWGQARIRTGWARRWKS